jgi:hypothetical protein
MVQQRQKQRYDSHRKEKSYNVGDFVWVYRPLRKKGRRSAKLLHNYHGPFQVTQKLKSPTNALKLVIGRKKISLFCALCNLKTFHPRFPIPKPAITLFRRLLARVW